jgi:tripartite-type tricarboxylate transporter receptor subunit TctC
MMQKPMTPRLSRRTTLLAAAGALLAPGFSRAQGSGSATGFPSKPVRIVVPYPPGGTNDVLARLLAQKFQEAWGQPVVAENKPGAAGNIGAAEVARAPADGYTLLLTNININSMNPALIERMPFDPQKDLASVSLLGTTSLVLAVRPDLKAKNLKELLALARSRPGSLSYASGGNGSPQHMATEMLKVMTKTHLLHIPYRGAAPAITDLLGGQVDMFFGAANQLLPHLRSGRLRALAVSGVKRLPSLPDVPTMDEAGVKGYEADVWLALAAPGGTPAPVIDQINRETHKVMTAPDVKSKLSEQGIEVLVSTPQQMNQRAAGDLKRWTEIIRTAGIKAQ